MLGVELVKDRTTKEPLQKEVTQALYQECLRQGLIAMCYSHIIRINPPLVINEATALEGLAILEYAMGSIAKQWRLG
jgi:4-aminobutyrate aminotransferase/4-aminobutyrate aminotransferase/(S)-3-amino-2-methylpropionate transaminase